MVHDRKTSAADKRFGEEIANQMVYLRSSARRLCRNSDYAEDLTQDTLLSAWKARKSFHEGTNLKAWLSTILRNKFYSDHRRRAHAMPWDDHIADLVCPQPEEGFFSVVLSQTVNAITALPAEQKNALISVAINGESYAKAASLYGCPVGTVKSRVTRTRKSLAMMVDGKIPMSHAGHPMPRYEHVV